MCGVTDDPASVEFSLQGLLIIYIVRSLSFISTNNQSDVVSQVSAERVSYTFDVFFESSSYFSPLFH